jgi:PemK-like, MazF-like toxin of type II toxin-antitoxin system
MFEEIRSHREKDYSGGYTHAAASGDGRETNAAALIDHLRSVDKRRVRSVFGELAPEEIAAIDEGLEVFLGLCDRLHGGGAPPVR